MAPAFFFELGVPSQNPENSMMNQIALLFFSVCYLTSAWASNGAGYGGGESPALKTAYLYLGSALHQIRLGVDREQLGSAEACARINEPAICRTLGSLTQNQKKQVAEFLVRHVEGLIKSWTDLQVSFTAELILVTGPNGEKISVAARTKLDSSGEVTFNEGSINTLSSYGLMALVAHELGHKQKIEKGDNGFRGGFLQDNEVFGEFKQADGGRVFLDAMGATLAAYQMQHQGQVPVASIEGCRKDSVAHLLKNATYFGEKGGRGLASLNPGEMVASVALSQFIAGIHSRDFTLSIWVKSEGDAETKTARLILSNIDYEAKNPHGLELAQLKNGNLGVVIGDKSIADTGAALTAGRFHQVGIRRKDEQVAIFLDGKKVKTIEAHLPQFASETNVFVGRAAKPAAGFWEGNIPLISVTERALSDDDMKKSFLCPGAV